MKYINAKEVITTVKEIEKLEKEIEALKDQNRIVVIIRNRVSDKTLMTIGIGEDSEHGLRDEAADFVLGLINLKEDAITKLKAYLEGL